MEIRIIIDDRIVSAGRRLRSLVTRRRAAFFAGVVVAAGSVVALGQDFVTPHTFVSGTAISAADVNENFNALATAIKGRTIRADTNIDVTAASNCDGLLTALDSLSDKTIDSMGTPVTVTITLAPGTYTCSSAITFRHANGESIVISGGGSTPAEVVIAFPSASDGVLVTHGSRLGSLKNLTVKGSDSAGTVGVLAGAASTLELDNVVIQDFADGLVARASSNVDGVNVTSTSNTGTGVLSQAGASMTLLTVTASNNGAAGFNALDHGYLELYSATSRGNQRGYYASFGGVLYAKTSSATSNTSGGFLAEDRAVMEVVSVSVDSNGAPTFLAQHGGYIRIAKAVTGPGPNTSSPAMNAAEDATGAVVLQDP